jgi:hypothetical protein
VRKYNSLEYRNFIEGKNCIVVVPSGQLKVKGLSSFTDNFDCVVKTNLSYLRQNLNEDLSKRIDVVYLPAVGKGIFKTKNYLSSGCKIMACLPFFKPHLKKAHTTFIKSKNDLGIVYKMADEKEKNDSKRKIHISSINWHICNNGSITSWHLQGTRTRF